MPGFYLKTVCIRGEASDHGEGKCGMHIPKIGEEVGSLQLSGSRFQATSAR